jgi:branched-chain amino acid transport system substrate-binding protein
MKVQVLATGAIVAIVAAGCGSSSNSASTSSPSASPGTSSTGAPIRLGAIGGFTGAGSGSTAEGKPVLQAWQDYTNANGGIDGHPVKLYIVDDANQPATALSDVQQLVEQDHVMAIINVSDDLTSVYQTYVQEKGVPVIGQSESPSFGTSPDFFSTGTTVVPSVYGELYSAKQAGASKVGNVYCAEISSCALGVPLIKELGAALGVSLVYSSKISSSAADYTAPCLAAKAAGVTGLSVTAESTTVVNVAKSCYSQGYKPVVVTTSGEITQSWLTIPAFSNAVGSVQDVPWFDNSLPATQTMNHAIARYAPGVLTNANYGEVGILGWVAGMVFEGAAKAENLGPDSTPAQVIQGLDTIKGQTFGGLTPPLTYTQGQPSNVPCSFVVGIKNGQFVEPQGLNTVCMPAA